MPAPGYPTAPFGATTGRGASNFQVAMAVLAWPMVVVGPLWFGLGQIALNSGGGWMTFIGLLFLAPIHAAVSLLHAILVTVHARRLGQWAAGPKSSITSLAFYVCTALYPFTVPDFGDSGPVVLSRLMAWFGVSESISSAVCYSLWFVIAGIALVMIVCDLLEVSKLNKARLTRQPHTLDIGQYQQGTPFS